MLASVFVICLALYFAPAIVAGARRHPSFLLIFAFNLVLGFTLIGWAVALVWALAYEEPEAAAGQRTSKCQTEI